MHNVGQQSGPQDQDYDLPQAWALETGDPSVIIAMCDSEVDWDHQDLGNRLVPGFNFNIFATEYNSGTAPAQIQAADTGGFNPFDPVDPDSTWTWSLGDPRPAVNPTDQVPGGFKHGTKASSIIAAERDNSGGIAGIAGGSIPGLTGDGVRVMPIAMHLAACICVEAHPAATNNMGVQILSAPPPISSCQTGFYSLYNAINAIASTLEYLTYMRVQLGVNIRVATFQTWAYYQQVCPGEQDLVRERLDAALEAAHNAGILVVTAAGNNNGGPVIDFATHPRTFSVADLTMDGVLSPTCSWGTATGHVDLAAFGSQIPSAVPELQGDPEFDGQSTAGVNDYESNDCGTSFAAPSIAGIAALMWSLDPTLSVDQVRQYLVSSADGLGDPLRYGAGRANAYNALLSVLYGVPGFGLRPGDLDLDRDVDLDDLQLLDDYLNSQGLGSTPACLMDLNSDGAVDAADYSALKSFIGSGFPDLVVPVGCL